MSRNRQEDEAVFPLGSSESSAEAPTGDQAILRALVVRYPDGFRIPRHAHDWHQLVHATDGSMDVLTEGKRWLVPPGRALTMPAGVHHSIACIGAVTMRTLYLPESREIERLLTPSVMGVSALLRELIVFAADSAPLSAADSVQERLAQVVHDQLAIQPLLPVELPWPTDERASHAASYVWAEPSRPSEVADVALVVGTSARTLERLFVKETGLPFGRWRRQARLLAAARLLAEGRTVSDVAFDVGYESTSAFVAMFRRELGVTPGRFASTQGAGDAAQP